METTEQKSFLESDIYVNPRQAFDEVVARLSADNGDIKAYLDQLLASENPRDNSHQEAIKPILEALLKEGKKEQAGLLFNIHRILTQFQGYATTKPDGTNEPASSDVDACFKEDAEIPEQGAIVVDFFVTRNLPKIIEICESREIDLSRIRVCVPKGVLAAQLMGMNEAKKQEFEEACAKLKEDQFIVRDLNHNAEFGVDEDVAIWFSPRTMPITPLLHEKTEGETIQSFCDYFRAQVAKVVKDGRIYANLAYEDNAPWSPLKVETTTGKRTLTKLTGISREVAIAIVDALIDQGFTQLPTPQKEENKDGKDEHEYKPKDRNPEINHDKLARELHLVRK